MKRKKIIFAYLGQVLTCVAQTPYFEHMKLSISQPVRFSLNLYKSKVFCQNCGQVTISIVQTPNLTIYQPFMRYQPFKFETTLGFSPTLGNVCT